MASVHRRSLRSKIWWAAFTGADGRRFYRSTKVKDKTEALKIASEWELLAQGDPVEAHFRKVAADLYQQRSGKALHYHSCGQWLASWLKAAKSSVADSTYERYSGSLKDFREFIGMRDKAPLAAITPDEITSYRDALLARGLAASTVNLVVRKVIAAPFEEARRRGYITMNPCAPVKLVKDKVARAKARRQAFTPEHIKNMLATSRTDKWKDTGWEGAILCSYTSAMRLGDIIALTWDQIDLDEKVVTVVAEKTEEELKIPMHPAFLAWLKKRERGIGKAAVFPNLNGRNIGGANGLSNRFKRLMSDAGVFGEVIRSGGTAEQRKKAKGGAGRTITTLSFHSLRHTATSLMANAGVAADTRKAITGHKDDRVHEAYTHHQMETLREAVNKIAVPEA